MLRTPVVRLGAIDPVLRRIRLRWRERLALPAGASAEVVVSADGGSPRPASVRTGPAAPDGASWSHREIDITDVVRDLGSFRVGFLLRARAAEPISWCLDDIEVILAPAS